MKVRLHGTADECRTAAALVATVLDVRSTSAPYPDRGPSRLVRVYLDVDPPAGPAAPPTWTGHRR